MDLNMTINRCGDNSLIGTIIQHPDFGSIVRADGLKKLRSLLREKNEKINLTFPRTESEEIRKQISDLNMEGLFNYHSKPDLYPKDK